MTSPEAPKKKKKKTAWNSIHYGTRFQIIDIVCQKFKKNSCLFVLPESAPVLQGLDLQCTFDAKSCK